MAVAFVADGGYNSNGALTVALTKPAGTVSGTVLVAFVAVQNAGGTGGSTIAAPSGWVLGFGPQASANWGGAGGAYSVLYAFVKLAGGSEPATYTFTATLDSGASSPGLDGDIRSLSGASGAVNYAVGVSAVAAASNATIPTFSGHETVVSGEMYVACSIDSSNGVPTSTPTLSDVFSTTGANHSYYIGDSSPVSAPGTELFSYGAANGIVAIGLTLLPVGGAPPSNPFALSGSTLIFM